MGLGNVIKGFETRLAKQAAERDLTAEERAEYQAGLAYAQGAFAQLVEGRTTVSPLGHPNLARQYRLSAIYSAQNMGQRVIDGYEVPVYVQPAEQKEEGSESLELSVHVPHADIEPTSVHLNSRNSHHIDTLCVSPAWEPTRTRLQGLRDFNSLMQEVLEASQADIGRQA